MCSRSFVFCTLQPDLRQCQRIRRARPRAAVADATAGGHDGAGTTDRMAAHAQPLFVCADPGARDQADLRLLRTARALAETQQRLAEATNHKQHQQHQQESRAAGRCTAEVSDDVSGEHQLRAAQIVAGLAKEAASGRSIESMLALQLELAKQKQQIQQLVVSVAALQKLQGS